MKLSYKYRGAAYLFLLVVLLPWAAWYYALGDTVRAAFECRRLTARLAVAETPKAVGNVLSVPIWVRWLPGSVFFTS